LSIAAAIIVDGPQARPNIYLILRLKIICKQKVFDNFSIDLLRSLGLQREQPGGSMKQMMCRCIIILCKFMQLHNVTWNTWCADVL